ncbi:MAG: CNNM domain-containing protein [bacterium]
MDHMIVIRLIGGFFLLGLNAFFVSIEFAMTRLRQFDESEFVESKSLSLAWSMTNELELYLTACQVGITITSILLGVVFEPAVTHLIVPLTGLVRLGPEITSYVSIVLSVAVIQLMHTVWGEQTPTYLGVENPKLIASYFAPPLYGWTWISYPLIYVGDHLAKGTLRLFGVKLTRSWTDQETPENIRGQIGEILHDSKLDDEETEEVLNTIEAVEREVREVVVPAEDVVSVRVSQSPHEALETIRNHTEYSRFPLTGDDLTDCQGILYASQILGEFEDLEADREDLKALSSPAFFIDAKTSINEAIDQIQEANQEMAIVMDRERQTAIGIVTDSHLFEAVFGEIEDPLDRLE